MSIYPFASDYGNEDAHSSEKVLAKRLLSNLSYKPAKISSTSILFHP